MRPSDETIAPDLVLDRGVDDITIEDIVRMTEILAQIAQMRCYPAIAHHLQLALDEAVRQAAASDMLADDDASDPG